MAPIFTCSISVELNVKSVKVVKRSRIKDVKDEEVTHSDLYFSILLSLSWKSSWLEIKLSKKVELKKIPIIQ